MVPAVAATNPGNSKYDGAGGWCNTKTGASMEILKMMKIGKQDCHIILWVVIPIHGMISLIKNWKMSL